MRGDGACHVRVQTRVFIRENFFRQRRGTRVDEGDTWAWTIIPSSLLCVSAVRLGQEKSAAGVMIDPEGSPRNPPGSLCTLSLVTATLRSSTHDPLSIVETSGREIPSPDI